MEGECCQTLEQGATGSERTTHVSTGTQINLHKVHFGISNFYLNLKNCCCVVFLGPPPPPPVYIRAQVESPGTMTIGHYGGPAGLSESCAQDVTTSLFLARTLNPCLSSSIPVTRAPKKWGGKNSGFGRYRDRGFTPLPALAASDAPFPRLTLELPVCMVCLAGSCCHLRPSAGSSHGFILLLPGRRIIDVPHHHHHHHSPPQLTSANLRSPNQVSLIRVLPRFFMGL